MSEQNRLEIIASVGAEIEQYKARIQQAIDETQKLQAQEKESQALALAGARVTESVMSAEERHNKTVAALNDLLAHGAISEETHRRAMEAAGRALENETGITKKLADAEKARQQALEEAAAKEKRLKEAGAALTRDVQTAQEKYNAKLAEYDKLLKAGAISEETHQRAVKAAKQELDGAGTSWSQHFKTIGEGLEKAGSRIKDFGASVLKYAGIVGGAVLGVGGYFMKQAMDAVESENLFEVSLGKMADAARRWSEETAKALGLNAFELRKSIGTFDVMLKSMGLGEAAAYDMAKGLTQLANDMASFYNLKPEEAFEKLRAGISGESEPLKALGILISDDAVKAYAMAHNIGKVSSSTADAAKKAGAYQRELQQLGLETQNVNLKYQDEIKALAASKKPAEEKQRALQILNNQYRLSIMRLDERKEKLVQQMEKEGKTKVVLDDTSKTLARYRLIMERTSAAQGDLARTMDSPMNQWRRMTTLVQSIGIKIGQALLPIYEKVMPLVLKKLEEFGAWLEQNQDKLKAYFTQVGETIRQKLEQVGEWIDQNKTRLVQAVRDVAAWIEKWGPTILKVGALALAFGAVTEKVGGLLQILPGVGAILFNPVGLIAALTLLVGAGGLLVHFNDELFTMVNDRLPNLAITLDTVGGALQDIAHFFSGASDSIELFGLKLDHIMEMVKVAMPQLQALLWLFNSPNLPTLGPGVTGRKDQKIPTAAGLPPMPGEPGYKPGAARSALSALADPGLALAGGGATTNNVSHGGSVTLNVQVQQVADLTEGAIDQLMTRASRALRRRSGL